jgi:histidinol-phosphatase
MTVLATSGHLHDALLHLVKGLPRSRDLHALDDGDY